MGYIEITFIVICYLIVGFMTLQEYNLTRRITFKNKLLERILKFLMLCLWPIVMVVVIIAIFWVMLTRDT